jgi:hypothetical protein
MNKSSVGCMRMERLTGTSLNWAQVKRFRFACTCRPSVWTSLDCLRRPVEQYNNWNQNSALTQKSNLNVAAILTLQIPLSATPQIIWSVMTLLKVALQSLFGATVTVILWSITLAALSEMCRNKLSSWLNLYEWNNDWNAFYNQTVIQAIL